jgi:UDP-N-acetylmuramoyl-L-alanine---L-glutamate ligase
MTGSGQPLLPSLAGRRIVVWGAGVEGAAAIAALRQFAEPADLTVVQDGTPSVDVLEGAALVAADSALGSSALASCDVIVKSPGISPYHGQLRSLINFRPDVVVTGGTKLWFEAAAATGALARTVAVTGSKGKSTTSSLIAHVLTELGESAVLAGNVGRAPIDLLRDDLAQYGQVPTDRWTVLEISSFQASEVQHSPGFGVLTALFPEHLDWHETTERYYADKCNLFAHGGCVVAADGSNPDVARQSVVLSDSGTAVVPFGTPSGLHVRDGGIHAGNNPVAVLRLEELSLRGEHNARNVCGALTALVAAGFELARAAQACTSFSPLDYRLQVLGSTHGRLIVDDGLSTAPEAAVAALAAYTDRPVTILIGGHDRELDYTSLAVSLAARSTPTLVLGMPASGPRILDRITSECNRASNTQVVCSLTDGLDDAVRQALDRTPNGGAILLSPAAPSFGKFANYKERSTRFRELVGPLEPEK